MAFMSQDKKKSIHTALKAIIPPSWKWTTKVRNHSTIVLTIRSAPVDLVSICGEGVNVYWWKSHFEKRNVPQDIMDIFEKILAALNVGNHDRSDIMTDYFDVGWYVDIKFGEWNKPFTVTA